MVDTNCRQHNRWCLPTYCLTTVLHRPPLSHSSLWFSYLRSTYLGLLRILVLIGLLFTPYITIIFFSYYYSSLSYLIIIIIIISIIIILLSRVTSYAELGFPCPSSPFDSRQKYGRSTPYSVGTQGRSSAWHTTSFFFFFLFLFPRCAGDIACVVLFQIRLPLPTNTSPPPWALFFYWLRSSSDDVWLCYLPSTPYYLPVRRLPAIRLRPAAAADPYLLSDISFIICLLDRDPQVSCGKL
ncbi:hypothetical protein BO94DRAFT_371724 [Aspergillus sclerotioniger CBS 115572]|uniref:Uncharacterized protein n=1 Tax=Aspergillus sclerotioniger CBS 115572 TaxID=1450535 RepID=A0A317X3X5_9EURO|nr:hypothetical protein BO94DRAFT_371724 [Aspergillus sclerotioniger CBS 115572]PWY93334.1 hypothetical protein BO94DRAFT_371724 [Aspergillus sclerotioniger CBS 115572]